MPIPTDPVSVTLALGAAPYQKTLTAKLLSAGMLRQVLEFVPYVEIQEPNGTGALERVRSFPAYTLLKRVVMGNLAAFASERAAAAASDVERVAGRPVAVKKDRSLQNIPRLHCTLSGELARRQAKRRDHAGGERSASSAALEESRDGGVPAVWRE